MYIKEIFYCVKECVVFIQSRSSRVLAGLSVRCWMGTKVQFGNCTFVPIQLTEFKIRKNEPESRVSLRNMQLTKYFSFLQVWTSHIESWSFLVQTANHVKDLFSNKSKLLSSYLPVRKSCFLTYPWSCWCTYYIWKTLTHPMFLRRPSISAEISSRRWDNAFQEIFFLLVLGVFNLIFPVVPIDWTITIPLAY